MQSMTAFARKECSDTWGSLVWEIRSVNHRYLEPGFRLPETFRALEPALRDVLRKHLQRGKVDCTLQFVPATQRDSIVVDELLVRRYVQAAETIQQWITNPAPMNAVDFLFKPGVLCENNADREALAANALSLFSDALQELQVVRAREGAALAVVIQDRLQKLREQAAIVRQVLPDILIVQRQKLQERLAVLQGDINQDRVEQELVHLAQRCDVDEELDRLATHIAEVERNIRSKGSVGRKLDFLMQELNREANTLSSKSISATTTQAAVDMKVLIEQMREQVQNIE